MPVAESTITHHIKLIIAEPNKLVRAGIRSFFSGNQAFEIMGETGQAEDILAHLQTCRADIVLMDQALLDKEGVSLIRKLKERFPETRLIVLASRAQKEDIYAALSAGADAYCQKEQISPGITDIVMAVLEGGAWLDPDSTRHMVSMLTEPRKFRGQLVSNGSHAEPGKPKQPVLGLTEREFSILTMIVDGKNNAEIAQALHVSYHTVKADVTSLLQKLSVSDRVQAAVKALKENLVEF